MSTKSLMGYLWCVAESVITAARVTSEPVPAVVGTAMSSGRRRCTRKRPRILFTGLFGWAMRAPTALAQSMAEPPPKPIIAWHSAER